MRFKLLSVSQNQWIPASIGNNIIAQGAGIPTTIQSLQAGQVEASIEIAYEDERGKVRYFTSYSESLKDIPLLDLANGVLTRFPYASHINLGAIEPSSAFVNDEGIRATAIVKSIAELPFSGLPFTMESLKQLTLKHISKLIIKYKKYMKDDAIILVRNEKEELVGEGLLSLQ